MGTIFQIGCKVTKKIANMQENWQFLLYKAVKTAGKGADEAL